MDFSLTPEQDAFRQTVRAWLKANLPREWKDLGRSDIPRIETYEILKQWQRKLYDAGFVGLTWPKEYGGRGLTFMEELILQEEIALAKAPPRSSAVNGPMHPATKSCSSVTIINVNPLRPSEWSHYEAALVGALREANVGAFLSPL